MQLFRFFVFFLSITLMVACQTNKMENIVAKRQAKKIIETLNLNDLKIFKYWNYTQRGDLGFWDNDSSDPENRYTCSFNESNDSLIIDMNKPAQFIKDFNLEIPFDGSLIKLRPIKSFDTCYFLTEDTLKGHTIYISVIYPDHPVFKIRNPFNFLQYLTRLKDSLKIIGISCENRIGNFIEFYIPGPYILTYFPDSLYLNALSKDIWQKDFDRGKMLNKNWNLREPL